MKKKMFSLCALILAFSMVIPSVVFANPVPEVGNASFQANLAKYPGLYSEETGTTMPAWEYDTTNEKNIVEEVYVEVPCDTDGDGNRDLIRLWIRRPGQSAEPGITVPVIYEQSPYREGTNPLVNHDINIPLKVNPDKTNLTYNDILSGKKRAADWYWGTDAKLSTADKVSYGANGIPASRGDKQKSVNGAGGSFNGGTWATSGRYTWYNYFVPRGYALILGSSIGNKLSEGFTNCGDVEETLCAMATIKWLNGECKAYTDQTCTTEVDATQWSNGNVAMLGQSYNGTIPIATACSGVEGLKAILPVAGISSWYDYYRENGGVIAANNFQGEDADILAVNCDSRRMNLTAAQTGVPSWFAYYTTGEPFSALRLKYEDFLAQMRDGMDRNTGDYNSFWDDRNYLATVDKVNCGIILSHGFNDFNVKPKQMDQFYQAVKAKTNAPIKLMLHRGAHAQIWDYEQPKFMEYAHKWFDHFLYGIENRVVETMPEVSIANNLTGDFEFYNSWPVPGSQYTKYYLNPGDDGAAGAFSITPPAPKKMSVKDSLTARTGSNLSTSAIAAWETAFINAKNITAPSTERLAFLSDITENVRLSGTIKATLEIAADKPYGYISAYLVDLGSDTRAFGTKNMSVVPAEKGVQAYQLVDYTIAATLSDYKIICTGHADVQNPNPSGKIYKDAMATNFIPEYYYQTVETVPGKFYSYTFEFEPNDYTFKPGNQMGILVFSTDYRNTPTPAEPAELTIQFGEGTFIQIPAIGQFNTTDADPFIKLSVDKEDIYANTYFSVDAVISQEIEGNVAVLDYLYDTDKFDYAGVVELNGATLVDTQPITGGTRFIVMVQDYKLKDLISVMFKAKVNVSDPCDLVTVNAKIVVKDEDGEKGIVELSSDLNFVPGGVDDITEIDLIYLSGVIDAFGFKNSDPEWPDVKKYDFNRNGEIDIPDVVYAAKRLRID